MTGARDITLRCRGTSPTSDESFVYVQRVIPAHDLVDFPTLAVGENVHELVHAVKAAGLRHLRLVRPRFAPRRWCHTSLELGTMVESRNPRRYDMEGQQLGVVVKLFFDRGRRYAELQLIHRYLEKVRREKITVPELTLRAGWRPVE